MRSGGKGIEALRTTRAAKLIIRLGPWATLAFLFTSLWAPTLATGWLLNGEKPVRSDMIVVLAGGSRERIATGLQLYQAGYAPRISITSPNAYPGWEISFLEQSGVPPEAVVLPLMAVSSTYDEAVSIRALVIAEKLQSVLIVTSPYHCRRAAFLIGRLLADRPVRVTVTPSMSLYMDVRQWWRTKQGWITAGLEFPKILWAWMSVTLVPSVGADDHPR